MTMPRTIEPVSPPIGLSESEAARHVGFGPTRFRELVKDGVFPKPRRIGKRVLWSRLELETAFHSIPADEAERENEWDTVL